jgi:2-keto-4-pentenoate hydratase/2-oxohepta-3-ene-1,7-dioic acid hydratase in catechol pathway
MPTRRHFLGTSLIGAATLSLGAQQPPAGPAGTRRFVRYEFGGKAHYGEIEGDSVHELSGPYYLAGVRRVGPRRKLAEVRLLVPCEPSKVLAVGLNYKSHLGSREAPSNPEIFIKTPSCLIPHETPIVLPAGTNNVHYETELVAVIGKRASRVSVAEARGCVFGVTCGNDVSARDWQRADLQWWRAKSSDTFGPLGPWVVTGLDYGKLPLAGRLNGQVKQAQSTADLLFDVPTIVSFISQAMTLLPGDVIYTGTPGQTSAMKSGDVFEVDIEGIGVLRNGVA